MENIKRINQIRAATLGGQTTSETGAAATLRGSRVLRNTYALLAMTLLFSAGVAATSVAISLPSPGIIITLVVYFGLLFAIHKLQNSAAALPAVFALTGFMGYTLGPLLSKTLSLPGGGQIVTLALGATGVTFLALSAYVLSTKRDFSFMGGFLFAGMVIALLTGLGAVFFQIPMLGLAVSAMVALLSSWPYPVRNQPHRERRRKQLRTRDGKPVRLGLQPLHELAATVRHHGFRRLSSTRKRMKVRLR